MDPEANLKEQLEICRRMMERQDEYDEDTMNVSAMAEYRAEQAEDGERLAELVEALNGWILKGGFLPKPWHDVQVGKVLT